MNRTPEQYKQLKDLFNKAIDLPAADRIFFIDSSPIETEMRRELEQMLSSIENGDESMETPAIEHLLKDHVPTSIGSYRILGEIGVGGMGTVYEAIRESEDFTQRAALKVIRNGMSNMILLRRFRAEQKILASLEHPNIARFLDGGTTTDGDPYYAMEFVEGLSVVEHCRSNALSEKAIIELFRRICSAVSYAHSQLIVHRDIKPSNIMVNLAGDPKLLDFGIAKLLETDNSGGGTETQFGMLTPQYASPEQIRGEKVTTISDVYSLGMILHELLTGKLPYITSDKTLAQIIEIVSVGNRSSAALTTQGRNRSTIFPSTDIQQIVNKALQKDPSRRYASVESLSDDLGRYLSGRPILARPDSVGYRFRKFIQRNRVAAAISLIAFVSLLGGTAATYWQSQKAEKQRILAEKRFAEVRNIANNVVFKYHDEIAKLDGSTAVRQMLVSDALTYLDTIAADSSDDIGLQRELGLAYLKLGDVQGKLYSANIGDTSSAHSSYLKAVSLLGSVVAADPENMDSKEALLRSYDSLLSFLHRVEHTGETREELLTKASQLMEKMSAEAPDNLEVITQRANLYIRIGDFYGHITRRDGLEKKFAIHSMALPLVEKLERSGSRDPEVLRTVARVYQRIGTDLMWLGEYSENNHEPGAGDLFRKAIPYHDKMIEYIGLIENSEPGNPDVRRIKFAAYASIADSLTFAGDTDRSLEYAKRALELARQNKAADRNNREAEQDIANGFAQFGRIYQRMGDQPKALEQFRSAYDILLSIIERDPNNSLIFSRISDVCTLMSSAYEKMGQPEKSYACREKTKQLRQSTVDPAG